MARRTKLRLSALDQKAPVRGGRPGGPRPGGSRPPGFDRYPGGDEDRVETAAFLVGSILTLVALIALAVFFGGRNIENKLEDDILAFLRANDIRDVSVNATGMDVRLVGTVDRESVIVNLPDALASRFPARSLDFDLRLVLPPEPNEIVVEADPLVVNWAAGAVTVTGTMSDQSAIDAIVTTLAATFGDVDSTGLVVREGVPTETDWLTNMLMLMREVSQAVDEGQLLINPTAEVVQFAAEFETRQERSDVRTTVEEIVAATTFDFSSSLTVEELPPPPPVEVVEVVQERLDDLITGKTVEFESGSADLTTDGRALLDELLAPILEFPEVPIEISGHTDDRGGEESNLELSRQRAEAVVAYLVERGADPARFVVIGYGETQPIADNETAEGRAQNRRIEFRALEE